MKYPANELPSLYDIEKEHLWFAPHLLVTKLHKSVPHEIIFESSSTLYNPCKCFPHFEQ